MPGIKRGNAAPCGSLVFLVVGLADAYLDDILSGDVL
jgi:hypothetical protein